MVYSMLYLMLLFLSLFVGTSAGSAPRLEELSAPPSFGVSTREKACLGVAEVAAYVAPILRELIEGYPYDRLTLAEEFLGYYAAKKAAQVELTPLEALCEFVPSPLGNACFGLTVRLLESLPQELGAYCIAGVPPHAFAQRGWALLSHAAVAIPCLEGIVLLDPAFELATPLILPYGESVLVERAQGDKWRFLLTDNETIYCFLNPSDDLPSAVYKLCPCHNIAAVALKPMLAADRKLLLVSYHYDDNTFAYLVLFLDTQSLLYCVSPGHSSYLTFQEFLSGQMIDEKYAVLFNRSAHELNASIKNIILQQPILDRLCSEYLELLYQSKRLNEFF